MDADLVKEFVWSTKEDLQVLEDLLLKAEKEQCSEEDINAIYRVFHSVKGSAGLVQLAQLEKAAHEGESLLESYRKTHRQLEQETVTALLIFLDGVKDTLDQLSIDGTEGDGRFVPFLQLLEKINASSSDGQVPADSNGVASAPQEPAPITAAPASEPSVVELVASVPAPAPSPVVETPATPAAPVAKVPPKKKAAALNERETPAETAVRVDVTLLDRLMNLVGELVLTRNQVLNLVSPDESAHLFSASQNLDQVTTELQENIMRTRMQPIGNIFNKFPRIVRDLSNQLDKKVALEIFGKDTELDRTLLEAMRDPFTHILRNSIDHGIETPAERVAAGKPEQGTVTIKSFHEGGQVMVEVSDDGKGINTEVIKEKAVANGLITPEESQNMTEQEAVMLVCRPGFSTAESITNISGRGVGMDVVRSNIEKIGGSLDIVSAYGKGTCIRIKIPLTLAIIPALIVGANGDLFGIPQINLVELVGIDPGDLEAGLEVVRGSEVFRLRERLLTIVRLRDLLDQPAEESEEEKMLFIVVVAAGDQQFGLVVDDIYDTEEIVVKPLSRHLHNIEQFAGATIRGDGMPALILDMPGIARSLSMDLNAGAEDHHEEDHHLANADEQDFLVFDLGNNEQMAIPLQLVARIEQYPASCVTQVNGSHVICHDNKLLPIVHLPEHTHFNEMNLNDDDSVYAIIINTRGGIGILAKELVDNMAVDLDAALTDNEFMGNDIVTSLVVVNDVPTAIIDVFKVIDRAFPEEEVVEQGHVLVEQNNAPKTPKTGGKKARILFCDDAQFFRNTVSTYIKDAGHQVDVFENGKEAIDHLKANPDAYNMVLTDLEMPVMDGWEVIKYVRSMPQYDNMPVVALTSLDDELAQAAYLTMWCKWPCC